MTGRDDAGQRLARWCASATDVSTFGHDLLARLGSVIASDGSFLAVVDPATLLYTRAIRRNMPEQASPAFIAAEFGADDVNQLRHLVLQPNPVGWLDAATRGDRMAAGRYRTAMLPYGLGDELRVALVVDGTCWGLLCLHRATAHAGFEPTDAVALAALAPTVAGALRRALVTEQALADLTDDGPGVALLNRDGSVASVTAAAARWLAELAESNQPRSGGLPTVVRSVVQRLQGPGPGVAVARVLAPSGRWLTVSASHLDDLAASVAVVIEPASPVTLAPLIVAGYGLTAREGDVTRLLLTGAARKTIAARLRISQHTVNDHVKSVFDKTGASSAGELRERVFRHPSGRQ